MKSGVNYLVHCGDWHTFVGEFVEQVSPLLYAFRQVSKISDTNNGDVWHNLAADVGDARLVADYVHYEDIEDDWFQMPIAICAIPWKGDLPKRD